MKIKLFDFFVIFCFTELNDRHFFKRFWALENDQFLRDFRHYLITKRSDLIDSETFCQTNEDDLVGSPSFFIRSLERGDMTIDGFVGYFGLESYKSIIDNMTQAEYKRFNQFLEWVNNAIWKA